MDYNHIFNFLDKFKKLIYQKEEAKKIVIEIITEEISFQIEESSVTVKNGFIYFKGSPLLRNEVMMHKKEILSKLKDLLPNNNFIDIK